MILLLFLLKKVITKFNFWYMNKTDAKNMMKNSNLNKRSGLLNFFYSINIRKNEYLLSKKDY